MMAELYVHDALMATVCEYFAEIVCQMSKSSQASCDRFVNNTETTSLPCK